MTTRADRRHLDFTIRTAVHGAFAELIGPLLEQPDFQKRLAMAIAARMPAPPPPEPAAAPPPSDPVVPSATGRARGASPVTYSDEQKAEALRHYAEGAGVIRVGKRLGISPNTIYGWVASAGIARPGAWNAARKASEPLAEPAGPVSEPMKPAADAPVMAPVLAPQPPWPAMAAVVPPASQQAPPPPPAVPKAAQDTETLMRDWLAQDLRSRDRLSEDEIETRMASAQTKHLFAAANVRRAKLGLPPFEVPA